MPTTANPPSKDIIETTIRLMRIPSTARNPGALLEAVELLEDIVKSYPGITVERFERAGKPSFLAYHGKVRPEKFDILLNAHVDVVPAPARMFKPRVEDGKLYGRGALDMKGTAAALTSIFCEMASTVPYALGLQIVSDEEIGGHNGARLQIEEGVKSNFVIIGEYSNDRGAIYNAARGLCWVEIKFKGKSAHSGHLWHGSNAVIKAGDFAGAVLKTYPTPDKETWTTTASIASLETPNKTYNQVPDTAILKIDFRFTQEDPVFQNLQTLEQFIHELDPEAQLLNVATFEPAINVEELNPYVQGLGRAMEQTTNMKPAFLGRPAGSDGRHFALSGTDVIEFGLYGKNSHSDQEYVELSSFDEYSNIIRAFLRHPVPAGLKPKKPPVDEPLKLKLLRQLVAMKTVTKDVKTNHNAITFITDFLKERGMHCVNYEHSGVHSLFATTRPGNNRPRVLLSAHIDVVPAESDNFVLTQSGDKLFGRGVADMKFAISSYLDLVDNLQHELHSYDFGILITTDEEFGGQSGVGTLVHQLQLRPTVAIVPDGGENWKIETFSKGVQWIRLESVGKSAHASRPWEGTSAITPLLAAIRDIEAIIPPTDNRKDTTLTVGTIEGGSSGNQIPATASAMLDIRYGNLDDFVQLFPRIKAIAERHKITAVQVADGSPSSNDPKNPYISLFSDLIKAAGKKPGTAYSYGTTDGRFFSELGIPTVIVAPESGGRHTEKEWLSVEGYETFCQVLRNYVTQVADPAPAAIGPSLPASLAAEAEKPKYVWFAAYATALDKDNLMSVMKGDKPEGAKRGYLGIKDSTPPVSDTFISIPYNMYFAGNSTVWGGAVANLEPTPNPNAHTIAHAYLITLEQFEELVANENWRRAATTLPIEDAITNGQAVIGDGSGPYDLLIYCGLRDEHPVFALTCPEPLRPFAAPSPAYTAIICKGLSGNKQSNTRTAIDYVLASDGVAGHLQRSDIAAAFEHTRN